MAYRHIEVTPLSGACGAVVSGIDLSEDLDEQRLGEVRRAFHENLVIFFRDQDLTEDEHKAFGRRFGSLNVHPRYIPIEGHPEIIPIRKDPEHTDNIGGVWHQDLPKLHPQEVWWQARRRVQLRRLFAETERHSRRQMHARRD